MTLYIDKSALVAEIERLIKHSEMVADHNSQITELVSRELDTLYHLLSFTNSLEVKEVDLEKELQKHLDACLDVKFPTTDIELIKKDVSHTARKFFELGLKASICEEPVSEDLEKAAYYNCIDRLSDFKAGAKWQKEQMMKDAIEIEGGEFHLNYANAIISKGTAPFEKCKVKMIIIKEG